MWTNTQKKNQHVENDEVQMRKIEHKCVKGTGDIQMSWFADGKCRR